MSGIKNIGCKIPFNLKKYYLYNNDSVANDYRFVARRRNEQSFLRLYIVVLIARFRVTIIQRCVARLL